MSENAARVPVYRAPPADAVLIAPLDEVVAVFHRASGITHLLVEPAPQILAALGAEGLSLEMLLDRLRGAFDLSDADLGNPARGALAERLDELVASGLVTAA